MSCLKLPLPPPLPPLTGGISIPVFAIGGAVSANLCCQFNFAAYISTPNLPPIPIPGAILAPINAAIAVYDEVLAALDLISFDCPLD